MPSTSGDLLAAPTVIRRWRTATALVVGLTCGIAPLGLSSAAAAAGTDPVRVTVEGTVEHVIVDAPEPGHASGEGDDHDDHADHDDAVLRTASYLHVDGELFELPDDAADGIEQGAQVAVTLDVPRGETVDAVLEGAATTAGAVDGVVQTSPGTVSGTEAAVLGAHTLTVLPVYWGSPDGATQDSLARLAGDVAAYWSEQSAGRISMQTAAQPWARIAQPVGCDAPGLFNAALAANPGVRPAANQHVMVYFPYLAACGWAGQGSVPGSMSWINGTQALDVAAHELGHNLGLGHANTATCTSGAVRVPLSGSCTTAVYRDYADIMGGSWANLPSGNLNSALAQSLGLATVRTADSGPVEVELAPLGRFGALRALAIPVTGGTLFVDYRPAEGRDVRWRSWAGVQVHLRRVDGRGIPATELLDLQPARGEFVAPQMGLTAWQIPGTGRTLQVTSVTASGARIALSGTSGTSGPSGTSGTSGPTIGRYIQRVYTDLFERPVDPTGLASWTVALERGTPRGAVANGITYSQEYRGRLITGSYQRYLGRAPDAGGLAGWLGGMSAGFTISQMESGFIASPEYYHRSGSTNAGWVRAVYGDVLGRVPAASEVASWTSTLDRGATRGAVAMGFLLSTEHLSTVVDAHYRHLLGRGLDPTGQAGWVGVLQAGGRDEAIIAGIVASEEYWNRV